MSITVSYNIISIIWYKIHIKHIHFGHYYDQTSIFVSLEDFQIYNKTPKQNRIFVCDIIIQVYCKITKIYVKQIIQFFFVLFFF